MVLSCAALPCDWLGRFRADRRGATAVEIGLIAPIFLLLVCAWIEIGLCLVMQSTLDNAARDASRVIRIGTATETAFKAVVCAKVSPLIPCKDIVYNVQSGDSFSSMSVVGASGTGTLSSTGFEANSSGSKMLVQVAYSKPAFFSKFLTVVGLNSSVLLMTTLAFENERY